MKNSDAPAYPMELRNTGGERPDFVVLGLTKREVIAAMAMQGILSNPNFIMDECWAAGEAIKQTDKLLEKLEEE